MSACGGQSGRRMVPGRESANDPKRTLGVVAKRVARKIDLSTRYRLIREGAMAGGDSLLGSSSSYQDAADSDETYACPIAEGQPFA